jgi:hypothetical protein
MGTVVLALVVAGCTGAVTSGSSTTASTTASPPASIPAAPSLAAIDSSPGATPSLPTTTQTAWGRIWDELPSTFPTYPGAEPAAAGDGPASAVLDIPARVATIAAWYRSALPRAGYDIDAVAGPLEDGSTVIDAVGDEPTCRVRASIVPYGSRSTATILFAAACPFR